MFEKPVSIFIMCGISGITVKNESLIKKMIATTCHRGPDDTGIYSDNLVTLGHSRLSIIDLSSRASQPMSNLQESIVISYNGEIYNFLQIKSELKNKGVRFRTNSDTEVIMKLYEIEGKDCFTKLRGIFAISIWDKKNEELILIRDPQGIKPLYYFFNNSQLIFSSELKAIYSVVPKLEIDKMSLNMFFNLGYITGPNTIWKGVKKLMPGFLLIFKNGDVKLRQYFYPRTDIKYSKKSYAKSQISEKLKTVVKDQLVGDVPVGLFLSGGIDSSLLLALMTDNNDFPVNTFSSYFEVNSKEDDIKFNSDFYIARATAKHFGSTHNEVSISETDILDNIEKVVWHMDEPASNSTLVSNYILAKETSRSVKVVMSGEGGDEVFGGYHRYHSYRLIDQWQKLPEKLRKNQFVLRFISIIGQSRNIQRLNFNNLLNLYLSFANLREYPTNKFLSYEYDVNDYINFMNEILEPYLNKETVFDSLINAEINSWMLDDYINRADKMSMAHGVENRVPFLDSDILELSSTIKPKWKYSLFAKHRGKRLLVDSMKEYLPDNVLNHPKTGWVSPISKWIREGLKDFVKETLDENYNTDVKDILNFDNIRIIVDDHISGKHYGAQTIWMLVNFQIWYKIFNEQNN